MPPPSLSTTTIRRSARRAGSAASALLSCTKAMSPTSTTVVRPAERHAERRGHDAVDAVGAPVRRAPAAAAAEPLEVADRHRRRDHQLGVAGQPVGDDAGDGRLGERVAVEHAASIAASARSSACRQRASHGVAGGAGERCEVGQRAEAGDVVVGVDRRRDRRPAAPGHPTPRATATAPSTPAAGRSARRPAARDRGRTPRGAAATSNAVTACGSAAAARRRVGEHRPPESLGERLDLADARARDDRRRRSRRAGGRARAAPGRWWRCRAAPAAAGRSAGGTSPTSPSNGSRNGRLRCTGPCAAVLNDPLRERAPARPGSAASGGGGVVEPAHRPAVQLDLVDRLRGADATQLGRPVGGEHDHRHVRQAGLDHGRMEVGGRRAAGAQQHGGRRRRARARARRTRRPARRARRAPPARRERRAPAPSACCATRARRRRAARRTAPIRRRAWRTPWRWRCRSSELMGRDDTGRRPGTRGVQCDRWHPAPHADAHDPRRDLVRRRVPVVLHRQAPVRAGARRARGRDRRRGDATSRTSSTRPRRPVRRSRSARRTPRSSAAPSGRTQIIAARHRRSRPTTASSSAWTGRCAPTRCSPTACSGWPSNRARPCRRPTLKERLLQAYFVDGLDVGDPDTLADVRGRGRVRPRRRCSRSSTPTAARPRCAPTSSRRPSSASPRCRRSWSTAVWAVPGRPGQRHVRHRAAPGRERRAEAD